MKAQGNEKGREKKKRVQGQSIVTSDMDVNASAIQDKLQPRAPSRKLENRVTPPIASIRRLGGPAWSTGERQAVAETVSCGGGRRGGGVRDSALLNCSHHLAHFIFRRFGAPARRRRATLASRLSGLPRDETSCAFGGPRGEASYVSRGPRHAARRDAGPAALAAR
ncbi:hypothetical protein GQ55_3G276300 [Panicum hallii var. hallii]|uniref:Uncharacterized protein n=1 Tax=Panicum hallii var. hallii TaxID=1504633 RepID=A0A2T7EE00_9POAL|nr:hypothetical protein GQ55_3G276300 [Panicum hallii var. hallii]